MSIKIIGVDPGFGGAISVIRAELNAQQKTIEICDILDTPITEATGRPEIDSKTISLLISKITPRPTLAVIEAVNAMPGQGVSSMFRFGQGYGQILGVLDCLNIPILRTPPAVWKAQMGITHDKNTSRNAAIKYSSKQHHILFSRKKDSDRAEAFLLALFGARSLGFGLKDIIHSSGGEHDRAITSIF